MANWVKCDDYHLLVGWILIGTNRFRVFWQQFGEKKTRSTPNAEDRSRDSRILDIIEVLFFHLIWRENQVVVLVV